MNAALATRDEPCLFTVRSWEVDRFWPHIAHHIERWIDRDGTLTADEVRGYLMGAKAQLWCMHADGAIFGIIVTRIEKLQRCTWGLVWGCAGDYLPYKDAAIALYGQIEEWFRDCGCEFVEWSGRDGWQRIFPGYERHAVVLRKRL